MGDEQLPARPAWETDFPIERVEAQHVTRREFAKFLVVVSGGMTIGSAVIAVKDDLVHAPQVGTGARLAGMSDVTDRWHDRIHRSRYQSPCSWSRFVPTWLALAWSLRGSHSSTSDPAGPC